MDRHTPGGREFLVADMALEMLRFLMLHKNLLVVEFPVTVVAPHLRRSLLLLPHLPSRGPPPVPPLLAGPPPPRRRKTTAQEPAGAPTTAAEGENVLGFLGFLLFFPSDLEAKATKQRETPDPLRDLLLPLSVLAATPDLYERPAERGVDLLIGSN